MTSICDRFYLHFVSINLLKSIFYYWRRLLDYENNQNLQV